MMTEKTKKQAEAVISLFDKGDIDHDAAIIAINSLEHNHQLTTAQHDKYMDRVREIDKRKEMQ